VRELLDALAATPTPMSDAVRPPAGGGIPAKGGVYAWWAPVGALADISGPRHPNARDRELLYVGICPNAEGGIRTMRDRLLRDHARATPKSTLRRALASFLWEPEGWELSVTRDGKPTLAEESESRLTSWMNNHLSLTWARHQRPWEVEAALIEVLMPPLNSDLNDGHEFHALVRARRAAWAAAARATVDTQ
jgi:hypothetical protein